MDIQKILDRAATLRIAVIGDLIADHYLYGTVDRVSPEAPVPVLNKTHTKVGMGGAGNVFQNLINLGVNAELFCNYDGPLIWDLDLTDKIHCNPYPYSKKTRVMCGNHQLIRIDDEMQTSGPHWQWQTFKQMSWWEYLMDNSGSYDAFVIADYNKGVLSDSVINTIIDYQFINRDGGKHSPVIVDAKKNFHRFHGAYCVKANDKESTSGVIRDCVENKGVNIFIQTRGEKGMLWDTKLGGGIVKGNKVDIVDVCGAGDTTTATLAICLSEEGPNVQEACEFANLAASEVCRHPSVYAIKKGDLLSHQHLEFDIEALERRMDELKGGGDDYPVIEK